MFSTYFILPHADNPKRLDWQQFNADVRSSVEHLFHYAKQRHKTQRQLADALKASDALRQSYNSDDYRKADAKRDEADALRKKLIDYYKKEQVSHNRGIINDILIACRITTDNLNNPPRDGWGGLGKKLTYQQVLHRKWDCAQLSIALLAGRVIASEAYDQRWEDIRARFDAVGATEAQRDAIKSCIDSLYGAVQRRWKEDPWIKRRDEDDWLSSHNASIDNAFRHRKFAGWKKATSKRRQLFLGHHDTFQFKSPRQYTEEAILYLIEKMELQSDTSFVRDERRTKELNDILETAQDQLNAGNFDAALTEYQNANRHAPNNAQVLCAIAFVHKRTGNFDAAIAEYQNANRLAPDDTPPLFHLAHIYAMQGEHLQEAVTLMQRALSLFQETDTLNIACARQILGWLHLQQGEAEKALGELEDPAHQQFASPLFYLVLGDAYKATEQHEPAERAWQTGWQLANTPDRTDRAGATPFEADQRAAQRADLGERLGIQDNTE